MWGVILWCWKQWIVGGGWGKCLVGDVVVVCGVGRK